MPVSNTLNPLAARLSPRLRRKLILRRVELRSKIDAHRPLPGALIIGAQRSGTSSMYKWLEAHPDTAASVRKETEYFSVRFARGERWYRAHFASRLRHWTAQQLGRKLLAFEATPDYLLHPDAAARAAGLVPDARLIVFLRDPVGRAISQHEHECRGGRETLSFDDAIGIESVRIAADRAQLEADPLHPARTFRRYSYLTRGRYAEQLERWLQLFDRSQLLVVRSEDMYENPQRTYATALAHLGLRDWSPKQFLNFSALGRSDAVPTTRTSVSPATRAWMQEYFRPHNERLHELLGRDFGWS